MRDGEVAEGPRVGRPVHLAGLDVHVEDHPAASDAVDRGVRSVRGRTERTPRPATAVLLLHHFHGNTRTWRRLIAASGPTARFVAFDRPGFGFTERPAGYRAYRRDRSVAIAVALLDHLGIDRAVVVGSSAGGTIALSLALEHPERVAGLVLVSPAVNGDVGAPPPLRPLLRVLLRIPGLTHAARAVASRAGRDITLERVTGNWGDPSRGDDSDVAAYRAPTRAPNWARGALAAMIAEAPPRLGPRLGEITLPTLVVGGELDRTIRPEANRRTATAIVGAGFEVLPGCGHTPQEECPDQLARALERFLAQIKG